MNVQQTVSKQIWKWFKNCQLQFNPILVILGSKFVLQLLLAYFFWPWTLITENAEHRILHYCTPWSKCTSKPNIENLKNSNEALSQRANEYSMLGFHVHFDQGYSNVENRTSKKILHSAFSVISVFDHFLLLRYLQSTTSFLCELISYDAKAVKPAAMN